MKLSAPEIIGAAIVIPIVSLVAVQLFKRAWAWFAKSIKLSFGDTVQKSMAKDLARLMERVSKSLDELRHTIDADHRRVQNRLADVENAFNARLDAVEHDLADIKERLPLLERRRYVKPPPEGE